MNFLACDQVVKSCDGKKKLLRPDFPQDATTEIGLIGLTMVVAGLFGSVLCGFFLDRTKLYK